MRKYIISIIAILASSSFVLAQGDYDLYQYSYENRALSTARVAAMGGAFTSLGADASSVHINPAGLALYRNGEMSLSPSIMSNSVQSNTGINTNTSGSSFNNNNFNAIFAYNQNEIGVIRGITLAFGYNVRAINNVSSNSSAPQSQYSIADYYTGELNGSGFSPKDITLTNDYNPYNNFDIPVNLWGGINTFNNGLISHDSEGYYLNKDVVGVKDRFESGHSRIYNGKRTNLNFSMGMKLGDYISVGMTLAADFYGLTTMNDYYEIAADKNTGTYDAMLQYEKIDMVGSSAFDFKVGVIAEPINGLRLGAAYHAPRSSFITEAYLIDQEVFYLDNTSSYTQSDIATQTYRMVSPSKLLTGASYVIKGFGIISADYQRVWYGSMKFKDMGGSANINQSVKDYYTATNSIYVGAEVYLGGNLFFRGGYNQTSSPFVNADQMDGYDESFWSATTGIGYKMRNFYLDFAYIHTSTKQLGYEYYPSDNSPLARNRVNSNVYTLTLGWKFGGSSY